MSSTKHKTNRSPVDYDIEIRIKAFRNYTIEALWNLAALIVLVGPLCLWIKTAPSTIHVPILVRWAIPATVPVSFPVPSPLRWSLIAVLYFGTMTQNPSLVLVIRIIRMNIIANIEEREHPRTQDLGMRTTNFEDRILAYFCVLICLTTFGFVGRYWLQVIDLTIRSFLYWICTMGILGKLFWLFKRAMRFYRNVKGIKHEEAWGLLISVNILRYYEKFEGLKVRGRLELLVAVVRSPFEMLKFWVEITGYLIGRGPLFGKSVAQILGTDSLTLHRPLTRRFEG
jgi:hypothetical protein